ncbi:hypothetical protein ASZ90_000044 [hydrocarbon metagenome]|uniref:Uncharacterized protein n=1 Tax=hydrocarbon metagenome TaxID=938273 RepID=A0A0W8GAB0_9ZZZZ
MGAKIIFFIFYLATLSLPYAYLMKHYVGMSFLKIVGL